MSTMYVVLRLGYEYNDEIYYRGESEGGSPIKIFHDKQIAEHYCKVKNIQMLKSGRAPYEYCYNYDEIDGGGLREFLEDKGIDGSYFSEEFKGFTDEDWEEFYNKSSLRFFEICAVDDIIPPDFIAEAAKER